MFLKFIRKIIPFFILKALINFSQKIFYLFIGGNSILARLYAPWKNTNHKNIISWNTKDFSAKVNDHTFPIPHPSLRMGYHTTSNEHYLESGKKTYLSITSLMKNYDIHLEKSSAILEWGCTTGRVLRHFVKEAQKTEFWGLDLDEHSILWAKENLSPPFNFLTCSYYPHLPFKDDKFCFIYGISVFTHMRHLSDMWLMEFNRILKVGGYALFTIQDEHTVKWLRENGTPDMIPGGADLDEVLKHDVFIVNNLNWDTMYTYYKDEWIKKEWGRYFNVVAIHPYAEDYQSAVILQKR